MIVEQPHRVAHRERIELRKDHRVAQRPRNFPQIKLFRLIGGERRTGCRHNKERRIFMRFQMMERPRIDLDDIARVKLAGSVVLIKSDVPPKRQHGDYTGVPMLRN